MEKDIKVLKEVDYSQIGEGGLFVVGNNYEQIGQMAFNNLQNLKKLIISDNVKELRPYCFVNCSNLENIELSKNIKVIPDSAFNGCSSLYNVILPDSVEVIGAQAFDGCKNLDTIKFSNNLRAINLLAFMNSGLEQIDLPESLTTIGDGAFCCCYNLKELELPKNVEYLGEETFYMCGSLKRVNLQEGLTSIGDRCFSSCFSLFDLSLPNSLKEISEGSFAYCYKLQNVNFPSELKTIGIGAFSESGVKSVMLPNKLHTLGYGAFAKCKKLDNVKINENLLYIPEACFMMCEALEEIIIPSNIISIKKDAFLCCKKLSKINIQEGTQRIGKSAFCGCKKLTELILPKSVNYIEEDAFTGCNKLTYLKLSENVDLKASLPFKPAYITLENGEFVITKQKRPNAYKCTKYNVGIILSRWNEKENLLKEFENSLLGELFTTLFRILPKEKFEEFYKTKNLKFYKRLYDNCNLKSIKKENLTPVIKFLYNMGAFQPKQTLEVTTKSGTKMVEVFPAQKVSEFFINKNIDFNNLYTDDLFETMKADGYKPEFSEFVMASDNFQKMIEINEQKISNFFAKCYNEFENVQKANTSNRGSGHKLKPTMSKFSDYFNTGKFNGVTEKTMPIAKTLNPFFSNQTTFDRAVEIIDEHEKENIPVSLIDLKYKAIDECREQVIELAKDTLKTITKKTQEEFTYEWLAKNDPTNLILGKLCNCCAQLEGQGYGIMRAGVIHPNVQNMVIKNENGEIVAKATLYINPKEHYGVFNTVSVAEEYRKHGKKIHEQFVKGAEYFVRAFNSAHVDEEIKIMTVGMNLNGIEKHIKSKNNQSKIIYRSLNYGEYGISGKRYRGDSDDSQYIIWEEKNERTK